MEERLSRGWGLMANVGWGGGGGCLVAACGAGRGSAGFGAGGVLIFGGWVPQDLGSSHVRRLKSSASPGWAVLRRHFAELLCASRDARAASLAATGCERLARVGEPPAGAGRLLRRGRGCVREGVARRQGWRHRVGMGGPGGDVRGVAGGVAGWRGGRGAGGGVAGGGVVGGGRAGRGRRARGAGFVGVCRAGVGGREEGGG